MDYEGSAMTAPRKTAITRADIMPLDAYGRERKALRQNAVAVKKPRRVEVGPIATFYFESYETMWFQVQEMLYIEKGGDAQLADELAAYNPLIPQGKELIATVMLEIEDPVRRAAMLLRLGGIENHMFMSVGGDMIRGQAEHEIERTRESDGKTSSVHFAHFPFTDDQILRFRDPKIQVVLGFDHPEYAHMAVMPPAARQALSGDFAL
jgi:hypothetical protein